MSAARKTIIESIRVDGFGRFHDFELELGEGLNVLCGPNEAGKSTLWSFISAMLFGFDRRNEASRYEPVGGAAFGGELRLKTVGGRVVVRRQGSKRRAEGEVFLRDAQGMPLPDGRLDEARGHVSRELFAQVFSLTIDQLRSFGELAGSEVSERLFAAAMQGAQRLPAALETLRKETTELFLPKGQRPLNTWLRELQLVRAQLEALGDRQAAYAKELAQEEAHEAALGRLEREVAEAQTRVRELERAAKAVGPLEALARALAAQAGLDALATFPLEGAARIDSLVKNMRDASASLTQVEDEAARLDESLHQLETGARTTASPEVIRAALRQWGTVLVQAQELPAARAQHDARREQLKESFERLPTPKATLGWLETVDVSVALQTELKSFRDRNTQGREERARVTAALASAREEFKRRAERSEQLAAAVEAIDQRAEHPIEEAISALGRVAGLKQHQAHLQALRAGALGQLQLLEAPAGSPPPPRLPLWLAGVATVALMVCGLAAWAAGVGPSALLFSLVLGLTAMTVAWLDEQAAARQTHQWAVRREQQNEQANQRRHELRRFEAELGDVAEQLALALDRGEVSDATEVPERMARLRATLEQQGRRATLVTALAEATSETQRVSALVRGLEEERARADATLDSVQSEVDARLAALGIATSLSAEASLDVVADLHRLQERALALETERVGLEADTKRIEQAVALLRSAAEAAHLDAHASSPEMVASLLTDWLEADGRERARVVTQRARCEAAAQTQRHHRASLELARAELRELLARAEVDDVETFRRQAAAARMWADAEIERRQATATLSALGADLHQIEPATIREETDLALEALEHARRERESTLEALGHVRGRLERFEVEGQAASLRRDEEALLVRIRHAAEQYTVSALARSVLERARERFDAEQQPRVVQRAASLFAELTDRRYLQVRPEAQALTVRDAQGVSWSVEQLSRGTRELLLLAFRLAVIEDFGEVRVALPVLLDDVTVNFDPDRAARVVEVLARLGERHQILAFTCHSQVRALFRDAGAAVQQVVQRTQLSLLGA